MAILLPLNRVRKEALEKRLWAKEEKKDAAGKRYRSKAQRDRDRVLYSAALHRLAYVTQVTAPEAGYIFHNRLTHSLKVAQVGRRNVERLLRLVAEKRLVGGAAQLVKALDADAVEASCLAHDLGHPPFGHIAEEALNECATGMLEDPFEGNAQSFRIVTRLAVRDSHQGLDLTAQTLNGLLKYPWRRRSPDPLEGEKRKRKWGYYAEDREAYQLARTGWPADSPKELAKRCLEAEIMDWADDLTYAVHDVDDFFRAGLIPLDRIGEGNKNELKRLEKLLEDARVADPGAFPRKYSVEELIGAAQSAISRHRLPRGPYEHTLAARAAMRQFASLLITKYLDDFDLVNRPASREVELVIGDKSRLEVEALKMLAGVYVIRRPSLAVVQEGQKRVVKSLFERYFDASNSHGSSDCWRIFPPSARERLERDGDGSHARVVLDFISGLTETAALELHNRLSGGWTASALDATASMG